MQERRRPFGPLLLNDKNSNSEVQRKLSAADVQEPVLGRLLREIEEGPLLLRLKDRENRCNTGAKLGVAWLIASIQQKYELHESTRAQIDQQSQSEAASLARNQRLREEADEDHP